MMTSMTFWVPGKCPETMQVKGPVILKLSSCNPEMQNIHTHYMTRDKLRFQQRKMSSFLSFAVKQKLGVFDVALL